jgi:hypothetical protein
MRSRLLAWAAGAVLLPLVGAGTAMADVAPGTQAVEQTAASQQAANADATSTQVKPTNQNISVRVLSPGDDGAVTQSNTSAAAAAAANANAAEQAAAQAAPAAGGTQAVGQTAQNAQSADSDATSTQVKPTNQNVSVRVLSPGDDGSVTQSNDSSATSIAANANKTAQEAVQAAGGGGGGGGTQAVAQKARNDQQADADATSVQDHPSNVNAPTRVLSKGDGGEVEQSNDSAAKSAALNANKTVQKAAQDQGGWEPGHDSGSPAPCGCEPKKPEPEKQAPCGCDERPSTGVQAIGQEAKSHQDAEADAKSVQIGAKNVNAPAGVLSPGDGGDVDQRNTSFAGALALNKNATFQVAKQAQGDLGHGALGIQAIGQKAKNDQEADADAKSLQLFPANVNAPVSIGHGKKKEKLPAHEHGAYGGPPGDAVDGAGHAPARPDWKEGGDGSVEQANDSAALAAGLNANRTGQFALQV